MVQFVKGQQVVHCRDGLAVIVDETIISEKEYFVVKTIRGGGENIYVSKERAENIIRPIMDQKMANDLFEYAKTVEVEYNSNTKQRRDSLKRRLSSGDVKDIVFLVKQLYFFRNKNDGSIKYGPVDLDMLQFATNNFFDELAITFQKPRDDMEEFVYKKLE